MNKDTEIRAWLLTMKEKYSGGKMSYAVHPEDKVEAFKISSRGKGVCRRIIDIGAIDKGCKGCDDCAKFPAQRKLFCTRTGQYVKDVELKPIWCPKK